MKELQSVTFLGLNEDGDEITATDILEPRNLNYLGKTLLLTFALQIQISHYQKMDILCCIGYNGLVGSLETSGTETFAALDWFFGSPSTLKSRNFVKWH